MNNELSMSSVNIGMLYEALCRCISRCVLENDNVQLKRAKSIISNNLLVSEVLTKELNLYNTILNNNFQDRSVAKSFLNECISFAKQIEPEKIKSAIEHLVQSSNKVLLKEDLDNSSSDIYRVISEIFSYNRIKNPTLEQTTQYYKNIESLLNLLTSEPKIQTESEKKFPKLDKISYECAVNRFNKKYNSILSESQKEIIQDFLMYRSTDRFKKSLLKRLKQIQEQLNTIKEKTTKVTNIELLQNKITEYYNFSSKTKEEPINNLMLNVCEITELFDDIKKYSNGQQ